MTYWEYLRRYGTFDAARSGCEADLRSVRQTVAARRDQSGPRRVAAGRSSMREDGVAQAQAQEQTLRRLGIAVNL